MSGAATADPAPKGAPAKLTYRVAAALLLLFCAGHTIGGLLGRSPAPEADVVLATMRTVRFDFHGVHRTFYELFLGHALLVSLYLAVSAIVAWTLSSLEVENWSSVAPIAWSLAVAQVLTAAVAWTHFFPGPAIITSLAAILLVAGNIRTARLDRRSRASSSPPLMAPPRL
jgi:hypothetical protein